MPYYLRRKGNILGHMGCYIAGITSCFIAAFVSVTPSEGIKLNVNAECSINFSKHLLLQIKQVIKYNFELIEMDMKTAVMR